MSSFEPVRKRGRPTTASLWAIQPALTHHEQACFAHWRAWWATRLNPYPSAYVLARRMKISDAWVKYYGSGERTPSAAMLAILESQSVAYGYVLLPVDHVGRD